MERIGDLLDAKVEEVDSRVVEVRSGFFDPGSGKRVEERESVRVFSEGKLEQPWRR